MGFDSFFARSLRLSILCVLISAAQTFGQTVVISGFDSLHAALQHAPSDADSLKILLQLARNYLNINPEQSLKIGEHAHGLSRKVNREEDVATSLELIGRAYWKKRMYREAIEQHRVAAAIFQKTGNKQKNADLLLFLGQDYADLGDAVQAEKYFTLALNKYKENGNKLDEARAHGMLGWLYEKKGYYARSAANNYIAYRIYEELGDEMGLAIASIDIGEYMENNQDHREALHYYHSAANEFRKKGDTIRLANAYDNIGRVHRKMKQYDSAFYYYNTALSLGRRIRNDNNIGSALAHIGDLKMSMGDFDSALVVFHQAEQSFMASCNKWELASLYTRISVCLVRSGEFGQASVLLDSAMSLSVNLKSVSRIAECLGAQIILDSAKGNWRDAFFHNRQRVLYGDSVSFKESAIKVARLQMQMQYDRQINEKNRLIELTELRSSQKRTMNLFLICGIVVLAAAMVILVREKRKSDLLRGNLQQSLVEKDTLMKEIHHRVKNNLQVISSLLRLQAGSVDDENARNALTESQNRVLSIALIHQKLYQDERIDFVQLGTFVNELFEQLKRVFGRSDLNVKLINGIENVYLNIDRAAPLGLILNELITNSFKYAFHDVTSPCISIHMQEADGEFVLKYADNGPGLPQHITFERSKTLGLRLVNRLSKQMKGSARYYFRNGSNFEIKFAM